MCDLAGSFTCFESFAIYIFVYNYFLRFNYNLGYTG